MNILILTTIQSSLNNEKVRFRDVANHYIFYSLEIAHELEKMGCGTYIKSIFDFSDSSCELEEFDIILGIGYLNNLQKLCTTVSQSEILNSKPLFTWTDCPLSNERVHTHFVMKLQTFFKKYETHTNISVELPIPKTLSFREMSLNNTDLKICIDGPARCETLQHLSPDMNTIYSSLLECTNPETIFQLSPYVGYYDYVGLSQFQPPKNIREIRYQRIPQLEMLLSSIDHFVITICESYGAMVADCLSTNTVVHYPITPLVPNPSSLNLIEDIPNCIPFSSASELCTNLREQKFSHKNPNCPNTKVFKYVAEYLVKCIKMG
jgi:hypothetical protein